MDRGQDVEKEEEEEGEAVESSLAYGRECVITASPTQTSLLMRRE